MNQHDNCDIKYQAIRNQLVQELVHATTHLGIWNKINKHIRDSNDMVNLTPGFWDMTMRAHLQQAFMGVARICDEHPRSANVRRFLSFAGRHAEIFDQTLVDQRKKTRNIPASLIERNQRDLAPISNTIRECRIKLKSIRPVLDRLMIHRDKLLAHIDDEIVESRIEAEEVFRGRVNTLPEFPVIRKDFEQAVEVLGDVLNAVNAQYEGSTWSYDIRGAASGVDTIFVSLRNSRGSSRLVNQ